MIRFQSNGRRRSSVCFRSWQVLIFCVVVMLQSGFCHAQNEQDKAVNLPPKNVTFKFVDADGEPIEGVSIKNCGFVFAGRTHASFGGSLKGLNGEDPVSAADGVVECIVPDMGFGDLIRVWIEISHDEFLEYEDPISVEEGINLVVLRRGVQIAVTAIDSESKQPITEDLYGIAQQDSFKQLGDWKAMNNGMLISPPLNKDALRVRLVQIVDGLAIRFSNPIDIQQQDGGRVMLKEVPMFPALKFRGKLSANVPRPIKNGQVNICVAWNESKDLQSGAPAGHWFDRVAVDEDGQFEINGIPTGEWLQLVASCDGWVNEASSENVRRAVYPALDMRIDATILPLLLSMKNFHNERTVRMAPRRAVELKVLDEAGNPMKDLEVWFSDYAFISNGTWNRITREELIASRSKQIFEFERQKTSRTFKTDENGLASIHDFAGDNLRVRILGYDVVSKIPAQGLNEDKKTVKVKLREADIGRPLGPPQ